MQKKEESKEAKEADPVMKVGKLKDGDYTVHILVETIKDVNMQGDRTTDVIISGSAGGQQKYTETQEGMTNTSEVSVQEHIFLELKDKSVEELETMKIVLKANEKAAFKEAVIGLMEFDFSYIYFLDKHTMFHQWIALNNPAGENYADVAAYMKISISITGEDDEPVELKEDDAEEEGNAFMPSSIKSKFTQLKIHIFRGENLPRLDFSVLSKGSMDAYLKCKVGNRTLQTKPITTKNDACIWNESFLIPVQMPIMSGILKVQVLDKDATGDEIAGCLIFNFKDLIAQHSGHWQWLNIYGAPGAEGLIAKGGDAAKEMNSNPDLASTWKGRILICVEHEESENPLCLARPCARKDLLDKVESHCVPKEFTYFVEAGSCIVVPKPFKEYTFMMKIGAEEWITTKAPLAGKSFVRWNERAHNPADKRKKEPITFTAPYGSIEELPDVFFYLLDGKNAISYSRCKASKFFDKNPKILWREMTADPVLDVITSPELAGIISLKMSIAKGTAADVSLEKEDAWKKGPTKRPKVNKVRAFIFQAKDLPSADADGSADPMIVVWDNVEEEKVDQVKKTIVRDDTCYPMWYQCLELNIEGNSAEEMPPFVLDLYDQDKARIGSDTYDYMCRAVIPVTDSAHIRYEEDAQDEGKVPEPRWHKCRFNQGGAKSGEVLVSFVISEGIDFPFQVVADKIPMMGIEDHSVVKFDEYRVEINVLGLRNLRSAGIMPVKKAYINFLLQTLCPPISASSLENIVSAPGPSGPNPTINTVVSFLMLLPVKKPYAPVMSCRVFDRIFKGFSGQLVGTFDIPVGDLMHKKREQREAHKKHMVEVLEELTKISRDEGVRSYGRLPEADDLSEDEELKQQIKEEKKENLQAYDKATAKTAKVSDNSVDEKVAEQILAEKNQGMKKSLLDHQDEDEDEYGNTIKNPVVIEEYLPPVLTVAGIQTPKSQLSSLRGTPRSQLTPSQRAEVDKDILIDYVNDKIEATPTKQVRINEAEMQEYHRTHSGSQTPTGVQSVDKFASGAGKSIEEMLNNHNGKIERVAESMRMKVASTMNRADQLEQNKVMPRYKRDKRLNVWRETNKPSSELYEELGWDREPKETVEKHYRRYYNKELETVKEVMSVPTMFDQFGLKRGQVRGNDGGSMFSMFKKQKKDSSGNVDTETCVGKFKGLIQVMSDKERDEYELWRNKKEIEIFELLDVIHKNQTGKELPFRTQDFFNMENYDGMDMDSEDNFTSTVKRRQTIASRDEKLTMMTDHGRKKFRQCMVDLGLKHLNILKYLSEINSDMLLKRQLVQDRKCIVRVYIVRGYQLASRDNGSESDPYFKLLLGNKEWDNRENYVDNEPNPLVHKMVEFEAHFPGCPQLQVQAWDYDAIFGDDLIGETMVDLEDRYFSTDWNSIITKPIETRKLYHQSSNAPQGTVKMWVEIISMQEDKSKHPVFDISPKPQEEFEIRVAVWDTEDLKSMDVEGTTDGFIKCFMDAKHAQETDTHFRNQDGKCSFNYRLLFRHKHPNNKQKLTVQAYDRDFFKSNDLIGEDQIDLEPLLKDVALSKRPLSLTKEYYDEFLTPDCGIDNLEFHDDHQSFWVKLYGKSTDKKTEGQIVCQGRVRLQIDVYPIANAEENKVGKAREEPNVNPYLPLPFGRISFTLNPLKMFNQLVGPEFRKKCYKYCCYAVCIALCIALLPLTMSNMFSSMIISIFTFGGD